MKKSTVALFSIFVNSLAIDQVTDIEGEVGFGNPNPSAKLHISKFGNQFSFFLLFLFSSFSMFAQFETDNVRMGISGPSYGVKIKANFPGHNGNYYRGFFVTNENDSEDFLILGTYGNVVAGASSASYSFIGKNYSAPWMAFTPDGKVGIGKTTPAHKLDVVNSGLNNSLKISHNAAGYAAEVIVTDQYGMQITSTANGWHYLLNLRGNNGTIQSIYAASNGNVGIGTTTPSTKLEIANTGVLTKLSGNALLFERASNEPSYIDKYDTGDLHFRMGAGYTTAMTIQNNGKVGIGTETPVAKLHVSGGDLLLQNQSGTGYPILWLKSVSGSNTMRLDYNSIIGAGGGMFIRAGGSNPLVLNDDGGNVGIGTTTPTAKLEVNGNIKLSVSGSISQDNPTGFISIASASGSSIRLHGESHGWASSMDFRINGVQKMLINNLGNVGIGTTDPQSKLAVNGSIRANEVRVLADISVPDYVFAEDYELRTLAETKDYIKENKHLPEIPSATEIGLDGFNLGEMNMKLLKKVEELTLYLIDQNKINEEQSREIELLKQEIKIK